MDWTASDYGLLGSALAAQYADTESTKKALKSGGRELNPVLAGITPDQRGLAGASLAIGAATTIKDPQLRRTFLAGMTGFEGAIAIQNAKGGKGKSLEENLAAPLLAAGLSAFLAYSSLMPDLNGYVKAAEAGKPEVGLAYTKGF